MLELIKDKIKPAFMLLVLSSLLLGLIYPFAISLIAQMLFPWQANGSLIGDQTKVIGSVLIGQAFTEPKYFWGRVSATHPYPYNAENSAGSNLSPSNPDFIQAITERLAHHISHNPASISNISIPIDLLTSSGSGLDPDISLSAAYYQIPRIARERKMSEVKLGNIIDENIKKRFLGLLGEPRVNVLELNLILDQVNLLKVEK